MKKPLIILLLFITAAISNAVMDTSAHHRGGALCSFTSSPFVQNWFNCSGNSWLNKYRDGEVAKGEKTFPLLGLTVPYPVQLTDAFHFFKMIMIFALCAIVAVAMTDCIKITRSRKLDFFIYWSAAGIAWGMAFNLFYSYLLR